MEVGGDAFRGCVPEEADIRDAIAPFALALTRSRLGMLGSGNHFLEMQRIDKVFHDYGAFIGLREGHFAFLMHTGSGGIGAMVSHLYSPRSVTSRQLKMHGFVCLEWLKAMTHRKRRRIIAKIISHAMGDRKKLFSFPAESEEAHLYLTALRAAANFAYANRTFIGNQLRQTISDYFDIKEEEIQVLRDASHMSIQKERINNESLWLHRSGAVQAYPAGLCGVDSPFYETGQPVFLPGSMGDATYLCVATEKNDQTYFSMGHGAGRLASDAISHIPKDRDALVEELSRRSIRMYKGLSKKIIKQAPSCFKNIDRTVEYLEGQGLVKKVAKLTPVAVLKG